MNKNRIIGLIILVVGLTLIYFFDNESVEFISGLLIGFGIGIAAFGQFKSRSTD